ncbi:hypothetical protein SAMD00019534_066620 [Acytostelium subglobosum LB1]|uniref:hypothetical protein n=1 Tax=Acytostelium subglobosum LB1 TaxID=1410327 RepID=UPI000644E58D|nr:hypothetical protein SAMD00019534_066620 [Acytostelium subglobosum LB1]GAM23487.1 hypothetical protein SAMD00019534_066620 [Acytostelium subglobosum LB1]|eukprot:XP_012753228.1 hypothetical protein SAMD00019534_066620 [Acytostelium subglobosum LB1]
MSTHVKYSRDTIDEQNEITNHGDDLLDKKGQLVHRGWCRQPLLKYNPDVLSRFRSAFRLKSWNYYAVGGPTFYFAVAAIDLGYVTNFQTFIIEFDDANKDNKQQLCEEITSPSLLKSLGLPRDSCQHGQHIAYSSSKFKLHFDVEGDSGNTDQQQKSVIHHIQVTSAKLGIVANLHFDLSPNRESVVLSTPIGKDNFFYNRKTNLIPVTGSLQINGKEYLPQQQSNNDNNDKDIKDNKNNMAFGIMDWGRGVWDYNSFWIWSTSWGKAADGRAIGLNLGSGFGDLSTHTENAINVDGVIHKLGHIEFEYDDKDLMAPWRFVCKHGRFGEQPLTFTPIKKKWEHNNFGLVMSSFHQIVGRVTGELLLDSGERLAIDIHSFTEVHYARW